MIVIYDVLYGPIWCEEDPDWDIEEDGEGFYLVCKIWDEDNNRLVDEEIIFDTLDEALEVVNFFKDKTKPFLILDSEDAKETFH
jgi:hypothetical protein